MDADRHAGRTVLDRLVDEPRVAAGQLVGIVAAAARAFAQLRIAQIGEVRVIELEIGAAGLPERFDLVAIALGDVRVEALHVRVGVLADGAAPAAEMQHGRRRDRHLGQALGDRLQKIEVGELDRLRMAQLSCHVQHGRSHADLVAAGRMKTGSDSASHFDAFDLLQKVDVEIGAAVLAVGDALQPQILLEPDDGANRAVFDCAQIRFGDGALLMLFARLQQFLRTQKAADVVRAERRGGA